MPNKNPMGEGTDFSSYLKDEQEPINHLTPVSPIQESHSTVRFTARAKYLLAFLAILAVTQTILVLVVNREKPVQIPDGYRLVTPANQPAYIELDK